MSVLGAESVAGQGGRSCPWLGMGLLGCPSDSELSLLETLSLGHLGLCAHRARGVRASAMTSLYSLFLGGGGC